VLRKKYPYWPPLFGATKGGNLPIVSPEGFSFWGEKGVVLLSNRGRGSPRRQGKKFFLPFLRGYFPPFSRTLLSTDTEEKVPVRTHSSRESLQRGREEKFHPNARENPLRHKGGREEAGDGEKRGKKFY